MAVLVLAMDAARNGEGDGDGDGDGQGNSTGGGRELVAMM